MAITRRRRGFSSSPAPTGEAVARHLDATIALLDKDGWTRTWSWPTEPTGTLPATDDETSVREMVRALLDSRSRCPGPAWRPGSSSQR
ncbi:hypothetical protein [Streptomyces sp. B27]|uniref:hypothetical protein n=1 Tax=Streptomyces sp. B27 TaxID=2485015 RepID=UPI000FD74561|nr:hypothetical protein [Streptomyces sp. B27]